MALTFTQKSGLELKISRGHLFNMSLNFVIQLTCMREWWTKPWSTQIRTFSNFAECSIPEHKTEMDILEAMNDAPAKRWYP